MVVRPKHLVRYKDLALLLAKHARAAVSANDDDVRADAERLASDLEGMGPTFVKLGQVLSTRADLLPHPYLEALARLQDRVEPFGFEDVEQIVADELQVRISKAFSRFDATPIASASLGQVHRAALRDGRLVAVKVQRPEIRDLIIDDMDAIASIASFADEHTQAGRRFGFADMVEEFRRTIMDELDYRQEAANLITLGTNLAGRSAIVVPQPIADYSTDRVLTMDYVEGRSIRSLTPLALLDVDGPSLATELFNAYLQQILIDGFFHADPHPGNVFVTDDHRLALLDLGMVARVDTEMQDRLTKLLLAVSEGDGSEAADIAIDLGSKLERFDRDSLRREASALIGRNRGRAVADLQAGSLVAELVRICGMNGLRLPPELTMLGKALLNLDEVARKLDPSFDPDAAIRSQTGELLRSRLLHTASPSNIISAAMEAKEFAERLPGRVNKVMDALAEGQLTMNVKGIDERDIMRSVQKLANRLVAGMVVAALVIGAALIMRVPTHSRLFGYPSVAIILFLIAAGAAFCVLLSIVLGDLPQRRRRRSR